MQFILSEDIQTFFLAKYNTFVLLMGYKYKDQILVRFRLRHLKANGTELWNAVIPIDGFPEMLSDNLLLCFDIRKSCLTLVNLFKKQIKEIPYNYLSSSAFVKLYVFADTDYFCIIEKFKKTTLKFSYLNKNSFELVDSHSYDGPEIA